MAKGNYSLARASKVSEYLEKAVRHEVGLEMGYNDLSSYRILDISIHDKLGGMNIIYCTVKHKLVEESGRKYNCSVLSVLSYSDWTLSSAERMGTAMFESKGFKDVESKKKEIVESYLLQVEKDIRGEDWTTSILGE